MAYYHVRITQVSNRSRDEVKLDFALEQLKQRVLDPYRKGRPITIGGKSIATDDIERVSITMTDLASPHYRPTVEQKQIDRGFFRSTSVEWYIADMGKDVTDELITGPPGSDFEERQPDEDELRPSTGSRDVFVVHGRNEQARKAMFEFLRSIDLNPLEWSVVVQATSKTSPYVGEILEAAFSRAHAVVVLFTPDDEARLKEEFWADDDPSHETELTGQARPNVLFEAGMAMGRYQQRTILVELGNLRPFSDVAGRHVVRLDKSTKQRQVLAQRLRTAGCPVNLDGTDWHSDGGFEAALASVVQRSSETPALVDEQSTIAETPRLSDEAKELLIEAVEDGVGIRRFNSARGMVIHTNGKSFGDAGNRQSMAAYEEALDDLVALGFVAEPWNSKGGLLRVTRKGFEFVEALKNCQ